MEYRLAVERGHPFSYDEVARVVGPSNVIRAVPQRPDDLLNLAHAFAAAGRYRDAEAASTLAVDLAQGQEPARIRRMEIALVAKDQRFQQKAAVELARVANTLAGVELAAEGLATAGDVPGARKLLEDGLATLGNEAPARLRAARPLFKHGDVEGARTLLSQLSVKGLVMAERIATEELLAEIADKQGNADAAAAARARRRMLDRLQRSSAPQ
jgi:thioredoxin-like negative regulator of GroEL